MVFSYVLYYLVTFQRVPLKMKTSAPLSWSTGAKRIPAIVNSQLVGTFPSIVTGDDGAKTCAFFVRASAEEWNSALTAGSAASFVKPHFVKTPQGPMIVAYCMVTSTDSGIEPFISETAIFPRLLSMPTHREIAELLQYRKEAFFVICNEKGACLFNSKARVLDDWVSELAEKSKAFDEGKQISDEKTAIMSLYWYQERYNPSCKIFEVTH